MLETRETAAHAAPLHAEARQAHPDARAAGNGSGTPHVVTGFDSGDLKRAFAQFPTGVSAVCALIEGAPVGLAASSFTSVSLDPPLVSVCLQNSSKTWQKLAAASRLGVSFLGVGHEAVSQQLAAKTGDRFAGIDWRATATDAVFIAGAAVWLECAIHRRIAAGDHEIVLLQIEALRVAANAGPLVYFASRYRQLAAP